MLFSKKNFKHFRKRIRLHSEPLPSPPTPRTPPPPCQGSEPWGGGGHWPQGHTAARSARSGVAGVPGAGLPTEASLSVDSQDDDAGDREPRMELSTNRRNLLNRGGGRRNHVTGFCGVCIVLWERNLKYKIISSGKIQKKTCGS